MLFTECQNSTRFWRYDQFNFWGLDFYIGNRGLILSLFVPIKSSKLLFKAPKLSQRCRSRIESQKKSLRWNIFKFRSKFGKFWQKMPSVTKMQCIENHILQYNLSYSKARVVKFGKCMQKKSRKNSQEVQFWTFDFFNFIELSLIF